MSRWEKLSIKKLAEKTFVMTDKIFWNCKLNRSEPASFRDLNPGPVALAVLTRYNSTWWGSTLCCCCCFRAGEWRQELNPGGSGHVPPVPPVPGEQGRLWRPPFLTRKIHFLRYNCPSLAKLFIIIPICKYFWKVPLLMWREICSFNNLSAWWIIFSTLRCLSGINIFSWHCNFNGQQIKMFKGIALRDFRSLQNPNNIIA